MAVTGRGLIGTGSATTAGTTITVANTTGAVIPAGTFIHITGAWDNIASVTAPTITSSTVGGVAPTANHATAIGSGVTTTAGSGVWHQCFRVLTTGTIASGATIATLTSNQSAVKRAAHAEGFNNATATLRGTVTTGTSAAGTPTVTTTGTALQIGDLVIGSISLENNAQATADADTTGGAWPPIVGIATSGGGAAANVNSGSQYKILTATGTQTFNPTCPAADAVVCVYSLVPVPDPTFTQAAYRMYADGTETGSTALAAQDTAPEVDVSGGDVNVQLRVRLQSTNAGAVAATDDYQLQWDLNGSGTFVDLSSVGAVADEYPDTNYNAAFGISDAGHFMGQSFTGNGKPLTGAAFYSYKSGTPTGNVAAVLYSHTGTYGTNSAGGSVLATSTSRSLVAFGAGSANRAWEAFVFDGSYTLVNGTRYVVGLLAVDGVDGSNYVNVLADSTSPTHGGNRSQYFFGGWSATSADDLIFRVYTPAAIAPHSSANLTDGAATTNRLGAGTGSFSAGEVSEDGLVDDLSWTANNYTELLYSITLKQADLTDGDTLTFRVLRNGATTGFTYTATPTIDIGGGVPTVTGTAAISLSVATTTTATRTVRGTALVTQSAATTAVGNVAPTVVLNSPANTATTTDTTPTFDFTGTDPETNDVRYQLEITHASLPTTTKTSGTDSGFVNPDNGADTDPFTSGENVQLTLSAGTLDRYSESNATGALEVNPFSVTGIGQSFTGLATTVTGVQFYLKKIGSPTGNATAKLYAHTGTFGTSSRPTGTALATSNNFDVATLTGTAALYEFTFPTPYRMTAGTRYVVTFEYSGGDADDTPQFYMDETSPTHAGNLSYNSGGWSAESTIDAPFYLLGPLPLGDYSWRVRAIDPAGSNQYGPWSTSRTFTIAAVSGTAALTATAAVTVAGTRTVAGTALFTISGSANATVAGIVTVTGEALISAAVTTTATGTPSVPGTAALTESVALTATGVRRVYGTAAVSAAATVTGTGTPSVPGTALLTQSAAVTVVGTRTVRGTVVGTEAVAVTATGLRTVKATVAVSAAATITVVGAGVAEEVTGTALVSSTVAVTAVGTPSVPGTAALAGAVAVTAVGRRVVRGTSAITAAATVTATGVRTVRATVAVTETATVTAAGTKTGAGQGAALVTVAATVTAVGKRTVTGTVLVSAAPAVTVVGKRTTRGTVAIVQSVAVTVGGTAFVPTTTGTALVSATNTVTAAGKRTVRGVAVLTAAGTVTVGTATRTVYGTVLWAQSVVITGLVVTYYDDAHPHTGTWALTYMATYALEYTGSVDRRYRATYDADVPSGTWDLDHTGTWELV